MMRTLLLLMVFACSFSVKAQTYPLPLNAMDYIQRTNFGNYTHSVFPSNKKWSVNTYTGISTGFSFFSAGAATIVAAPVGIQLTRQLNNNLFAFAGVSAAPTYLNFNSAFASPGFKGYPTNGVFKPNNFDIYSRAELGLMYVNDARTFSVSGSVGVSRASYYPGMPYPQTNTTRNNQFPSSHKY